MAFKVETSRALRTHEQLVALVRAVVAAAAPDETRAVEWKATFQDLLSHDASFAIGRAVLGLANRSVIAAQAAFEGVGYVVIGAEPQNLVGVAVPDGADISGAIARYVGRTHPLWEPRAIDIDGVSVLVVTVESPKKGDRIALLQKSFQPPRGPLVPEGTVFVRYPGATERAPRADLEMLQDRLVSGQDSDGGRKQEMRQLVADMVHSAMGWANAMEIMVIMTATGKWTQSDWIDWVKTDSGLEMAANAQMVKKNIRLMKLLTSDAAVLSALAEAEREFSASEKFDGTFGRGPSTDQSRKAAYGHINAVRRRFEELQAAAVVSIHTA